MDKTEYQEHYFGRIYGKRRAVVVENQDPERRGRIKVKNSELFGGSDSPWCMPCFPFYGGRDCGFFAVPPIGSLVWIECEEGLTVYPIYTGGYFDMVSDGHSTDGSFIEDSNDFQSAPSAAPAHGRGDLDGSDFGGLKGRYGVPASSFEGAYGEVTIFQTKTGHKLEFDDTEGGERIQIHHKNGAHIEIMPDGSINLVTEGRVLTRANERSEVIVNNRDEVVGSHNEVVEGNYSSKTFGEHKNEILGASTHTADSIESTINGLMKLDGGSLNATITNLCDISCGSDLSLTSFGDMDFMSGGKGFMNFSNSLEIPTGSFQKDALTIQGLNGNVSITSSDQIGAFKYGVTMRGGLTGSAGGHVVLGNVGLSELLNTSTGGIPVFKEPAVLGIQMRSFMEAVLTVLDTFFMDTNTGGVTPGFGGPNPVLAASSIAAQAGLQAARASFLTTDLILSKCVYMSKE